MSVRVGDYSSHADSRSALNQTIGDETISIGDAVERASDGQDAIMHAGYHLTDAGPDTSLLAQIGDVLTCFANDDTGLFGRDDGSQCELCGAVFLLGALRCVFSSVQLAERVAQ